MNVVIGRPGNQSVYSQRELLRDARARAKQEGARYVRHWVEVVGDLVRLRVEVKRTDGLGDILGIVL